MYFKNDWNIAGVRTLYRTLDPSPPPPLLYFTPFVHTAIVIIIIYYYYYFINYYYYYYYYYCHYYNFIKGNKDITKRIFSLIGRFVKQYKPISHIFCTF